LHTILTNLLKKVFECYRGIDSIHLDDGGLIDMNNRRIPSNNMAIQSIIKFPRPFFDFGIPRVARYVNTMKNQRKNKIESQVGNVPITLSVQIE
tara:strand:- start:58 stop:339 length:282 start_codon:yes stop_codon:yes gene_type:complete